MTTWIIMLIALITIFILKANNDDTFKTKVVIHKHKNIDEEPVPKYVEEPKVYTDNTKYVEEPKVYSEDPKYEEINDGK
jgi:hypothetical protein